MWRVQNLNPDRLGENLVEITLLESQTISNKLTWICLASSSWTAKLSVCDFNWSDSSIRDFKSDRRVSSCELRVDIEDSVSPICLFKSSISVDADFLTISDSSSFEIVSPSKVWFCSRSNVMLSTYMPNWKKELLIRSLLFSFF